jgi:hypothetical protein
VKTNEEEVIDFGENHLNDPVLEDEGTVVMKVIFTDCLLKEEGQLMPLQPSSNPGKNRSKNHHHY